MEWMEGQNLEGDIPENIQSTQIRTLGHLSTATHYVCTLVPRPSPQLLSLAVIHAVH